MGTMEDVSTPTFGEIRSWTESGLWGLVFRHVTPNDTETWAYVWSKYSKKYNLADIFAEGMWLEGVISNPVEIDRRSWHRIRFPVVRNVYPPLLAPDLVSVQPLSGPVGAIFHEDWIRQARAPNQEEE